MATKYLKLQTTIGAAGTVVDTPVGCENAESLSVTAIFNWGAGGTATKCYVQTTIDGVNWIDIICFAFAGAAATKASTVTAHIAPASQALAPSDGALADNTIINGVIGSKLRTKTISTGTYTGATNLTVTADIR